MVKLCLKRLHVIVGVAWNKQTGGASGVATILVLGNIQQNITQQSLLKIFWKIYIKFTKILNIFKIFSKCFSKILKNLKIEEKFWKFNKI